MMTLESKFKEKLYNVVGDEYELVGLYINSSNKVKIRHNKCRYEWDVYPGNIINKNTRCPKCAGNAKLTHQDFISRVEELHHKTILINTKYSSYFKKVSVTHTCGYTWDITPANLLRGKGCPKCSGSMKLSQSDVDLRMTSLFEGEYIFLESYINSDTPILCRHSCGHEWRIRPYNLFGGKRCPKCFSRSRGELLVQNILEEFNIPFEVEKKFEGCKDKDYLRFDFYLPSMNYVIEYDGEHHFLDNRYSNNSKTLVETKRRDLIKDMFCKDNHISMIRLPYYLTTEELRNELIEKLLGGSKAENL